MTKIFEIEIHTFFCQIKNGGPNSGWLNLGGPPILKKYPRGPPVGPPCPRQHDLLCLGPPLTDFSRSRQFAYLGPQRYFQLKKFFSQLYTSVWRLACLRPPLTDFSGSLQIVYLGRKFSKNERRACDHRDWLLEWPQAPLVDFTAKSGAPANQKIQWTRLERLS